MSVEQESKKATGSTIRDTFSIPLPPSNTVEAKQLAFILEHAKACFDHVNAVQFGAASCDYYFEGKDYKLIVDIRLKRHATKVAAEEQKPAAAPLSEKSWYKRAWLWASLE